MTDDGAATPSAANVLKSAREARGLSVGQVAEELRLTPAMIDAMDAARWSELGASVYARGHLRKYAALVGVAPATALAAYEAEHGLDQPQQLIPPTSVHTPVRSGFRWPRGSLTGLVIVVAALLMAAAWWLYQRSRTTEAPVVATPPAAVTETAPMDVPLDAGSGPVGPPEGADANATEAAAGLSAPAAVETGSTAAVTPAAGGLLRLSLAEESWVEIYDASGAQLEFGLKAAGTVRSYGGAAPWRLVLGNAPAATITLAGNAVEIPPRMIIRRAALITIDGEGAVRRSAAGSAT